MQSQPPLAKGPGCRDCDSTLFPSAQPVVRDSDAHSEGLLIKIPNGRRLHAGNNPGSKTTPGNSNSTISKINPGRGKETLSNLLLVVDFKNMSSFLVSYYSLNGLPS